MNYFSKYRLAVAGFIALIVLNLGTLATLWFIRQSPAPPPLERPSGGRGMEMARLFFERELEFTEEQKTRFAKLQQEHFQRAQTIQNELQTLRKTLFGMLSADTVSAERLRTATEAVGRKQAEFDELMFRHFLDIRALCDKRQQEKFASVIENMIPMVSAPRPPFGGPPFGGHGGGRMRGMRGGPPPNFAPDGQLPEGEPPQKR